MKIVALRGKDVFDVWPVTIQWSKYPWSWKSWFTWHGWRLVGWPWACADLVGRFTLDL